MFATAALLLFASVMRALADSSATTENIFMTIQTIDVSSISIPRPCQGNDCVVGTESSGCVEVCTGLSSESVQGSNTAPSQTETGGLFTIQTDSTQNPVTVPQATTGLVSTASDTGIMSIPTGEITVSTTVSAPAQSSTGTPAPSSTGDGSSIRATLATSMLSIILGLAWTLL
ncbi:hypothetical protein BCR34DRAFT_596531 [Clohesyomyces aquaticus]|uniref:GPI anchored protein n=1 Tax=Clohesyomyces aquaticus TaxID=1231657 RepID=A0A1Y2A624_9PLEO|nr:hypothetical protein BCR34DRAFT_596531 [Clohesyomyces aquaticus]